MLLRSSVLAAVAFGLVAASQTAEAGQQKRFVSPVLSSSGDVVLAPINPPLAGAYLTSRAVVCPRTGRVETMYYFDGRFADRPDFFYIVRHRHIVGR